MEDKNEVVIVTNVYGDVCIRKKARRKRQKLLVRELLYDYANNTTLHGLPYITRRGLTNIEKVFWFLTFVASIALCLYLISKVYFKWQTSPVIVSFSELMVPVSMVPFPSVTICPQSKVKVSVYNFTDEKIQLDTFWANNNETLNSTMQARFAKFDALYQICDKTYMYNEYDSTKVYPTKRANGSMVQYIMEAAPAFGDIFEYCKLHGEFLSCREIFDKVITRDGLCYNLNSLAADEIFRKQELQTDYKYSYATSKSKGWSMQYGYDITESLLNSSFYPVPGSEGIASPIIEAVLKESHARDELCNVINSGFRVYIQHPADLPQSSLYYYAVLNNQVSSMAISFDVVNTSETLRDYDPEIRQCYFPDERYLKYFKLYTSKNCRLECLSNITYAHCHCVEFFMPHSSSYNICTGADDDCILEARDIMLRQESIRGNFTCHCLPSCNNVDYKAEILKTDFKLKKFINIIKKLHNYSDNSFNDISLSKIEMYFMKPRFLSMRRSELFGVTDFLANCGGLLGLFLGFSFLSLVEIFYFITLRLCCTLKKDLEEERAKDKLDPGKEIHIEKY